MAALGPGEGDFYPLSGPNWGGGPAWESELYQGSPLPQLGCPCLSVSRCGLNGSHMPASLGRGEGLWRLLLLSLKGLWEGTDSTGLA